MLLWLIRAAYAALLIGLAAFSFSLLYEGEVTAKTVLVPLAILGLGSLVLFTDAREKQKQITTISAVYFGLLLGLLLGYLFSMALTPLVEYAFPDRPQMAFVGRVLLTVICCYVTISTFLQT